MTIPLWPQLLWAWAILRDKWPSQQLQQASAAVYLSGYPGDAVCLLWMFMSNKNHVLEKKIEWLYYTLYVALIVSGTV